MPANAMSDAEWLLELLLMVLLAATMFHAWRLEKALTVLRRDRSSLEELVASFNASAEQAEGGIERLRITADGAGQQIAKHVEQAKLLKIDLEFLLSRGEKLSDHLDAQVRSAKVSSPPISGRSAAPLGEEKPNGGHVRLEHDDRLRSQAERDLLRALKSAR